MGDWGHFLLTVDDGYDIDDVADNLGARDVTVCTETRTVSGVLKSYYPEGVFARLTGSSTGIGKIIVLGEGGTQYFSGVNMDEIKRSEAHIAAMKRKLASLKKSKAPASTINFTREWIEAEEDDLATVCTHRQFGRANPVWRD